MKSTASIFEAVFFTPWTALPYILEREEACRL